VFSRDSKVSSGSTNPSIRLRAVNIPQITFPDAPLTSDPGFGGKIDPKIRVFGAKNHVCRENGPFLSPKNRTPKKRTPKNTPKWVFLSVHLVHIWPKYPKSTLFDPKLGVPKQGVFKKH
jgi:hypothetical protein